MRIIHFKTLPSTQIYARESVFEEDTLIKAQHQFAGFGQRGRIWQDATGNFSGTFVFKNVVTNPKNSGHFSVVMAVGCARYFNQIGFFNFSLKWPNDIYNKTKTHKMGGILCEISDQDLLAGIGLNLYNAPFDGTTSLVQEGAKLHKFMSCDFFLCLKKTILDYHQKGYNNIYNEWLSEGQI